jgi:hypothetical protein
MGTPKKREKKKIGNVQAWNGHPEFLICKEKGRGEKKGKLG